MMKVRTSVYITCVYIQTDANTCACVQLLMRYIYVHMPHLEPKQPSFWRFHPWNGLKWKAKHNGALNFQNTWGLLGFHAYILIIRQHEVIQASKFPYSRPWAIYFPWCRKRMDTNKFHLNILCRTIWIYLGVASFRLHCNALAPSLWAVPVPPLETAEASIGAHGYRSPANHWQGMTIPTNLQLSHSFMSSHLLRVLQPKQQIYTLVMGKHGHIMENHQFQNMNDLQSSIINNLQFSCPSMVSARFHAISSCLHD
jgi:hypothetical protein